MNAPTFLYDTATPVGEVLHRQHQELVDTLSEVMGAYREIEAADEMRGAVDRLIDCAQSQFQNEELLLESVNCPLDDAHLSAHRGILAQMNALRRSIGQTDGALLLPPIRFLEHWIKTHIVEEELSSLYRPDRRLTVHRGFVTSHKLRARQPKRR